MHWQAMSAAVLEVRGLTKRFGGLTAVAGLDFEVRESEIVRRLAEWTPPERNFPRGYNRLFADHIRQADQGCDFDFLEGTAPTPEPEIH